MIYFWVGLGFIGFVWLLYVSLPAKHPRKVCIEGIENPEMVKQYNRMSNWPQFRFLRWLAIRKLEKLGLCGSLVDVGCGPGLLLAALKKRNPKIQINGIDISCEMVKNAKANFERLGINDANFVAGDVGKLPIADGTFDFAVSTLSLHHWGDPVKGFSEIYRILKPGGQLLVFDVRRNIPKLMYGFLWFVQNIVISKALRRANEPTNSFLSSYTLKEIKSILDNIPSIRNYDVSSGFLWNYISANK